MNQKMADKKVGLEIVSGNEKTHETLKKWRKAISQVDTPIEQKFEKPEELIKLLESIGCTEISFNEFCNTLALTKSGQRYLEIDLRSISIHEQEDLDDTLEVSYSFQTDYPKDSPPRSSICDEALIAIFDQGVIND